MRLSTRDMAMIPVMTAVVCAMGLLPPIQVAITPVPITVQTLGVMLSGIVLGSWRGSISQLLLLALVAVGAPVLSGGRGGMQVLVGPSAGYLWAFPLGAYVIGYLTERTQVLSFTRLFAYNLVGGVALIYAVGIPWTTVITKIPLAAAAIGSLAFVPGDLIKAGAAAALGLALVRALSLANVGPGATRHAATRHATK